MKYLETFANIRTPHRKIFESWENARHDINMWIGRSNVSVSVFWYTALEKKYDAFGNYRGYGVDLLSAKTDKLFFDIDIYDKNGVFNKDIYLSMLNLWKYAIDNDIRREIAFTGGGYQILLDAEITPKYYKSAIDSIVQKTKVIVDEHIHLANMRRIVGSYNFGTTAKSPRNLFCTSLSDKEVFFPYYKHLQLSREQHLRRYIMGSKKLKFSNLQPTQHMEKVYLQNDNYSFSRGVDEILEEYGYTYKELCPYMRRIIQQRHVGHKDRLVIIRYLKTIIGLSYTDCTILLPKILTARHGAGNDGMHSIEEGQVQTVYALNGTFSPRYAKLNGYCDLNCTICSDYLKRLYSIDLH